MSKNLSELSGRKGLSDNLFEHYEKTQFEEGSQNQDLEALAREFLIGSANTYGAISFYDFLKPENKGKQVYICNGSACLCSGKQKSLQDQLEKHFNKNEIGQMCCLGRCHENGAFQYKGRNYSGNTFEENEQILSGNQSSKDQYNISAIGAPVLTRASSPISEYATILQIVFNQTQDSLIHEITASGLRGRGGAGFPMGLKLKFCKNAEGVTKFIICNADEGDPGAYSDRFLLEEKSFRVLIGMIIAGSAVGAEWGVLYIRGEYPESVKAMEDAIKALYENSMAGQDILGTGRNFHFKIIKAQGAYICGEETALINSIEGQRPEVRVRPPYPAQNGLFNKPTVVNNVETLAALPFIFRYGSWKYQNLGTEKSTGTKLICLDGNFQNPGIVEVEMGTPLEKVVYEVGGGFRIPVKALHIGGPLGGIIPISKINELTLDFESFKNAGFLLGHASIVSIPESFPMAQYLQHLFEFAAHESCGKCFPCRLGTKRAEEMLKKAFEGDYQIDKQLFDDLLHTLEEGSLCAHGGGIPLPVRNALNYFSDELAPIFT